MSNTQYGRLVEKAIQKRQRILTAALAQRPFMDSMIVWARELDIVNKRITVDSEVAEKAAKEYKRIGEHLVERLHWPQQAISVFPQGSTQTQTLIAPATSTKFDIDAVCQVDVTQIHASDPMGFFDQVGAGLEDFELEEKNRCWRVLFPSERFYIDFTPSIPLAQASFEIRRETRYRTSLYSETALAVVDRPTKAWKTSNPEGFGKWVNTQAGRIVLRTLLLETALNKAAMDSVTPVPSQEVPLSDTLRVAIRLFKRHRDITVQRGLLQSEYQPISVIIATLLTQCYEGLADNGTTFAHPIDLLIELAELLPYMVDIQNGEYWIANPTVEGENFAERWNHDGGLRKQAFEFWCKRLAQDLNEILLAKTPEDVRTKVQRVFGCVGATSPTPGGGLAPKAPTKVTPVTPTRGLA